MEVVQCVRQLCHCVSWNYCQGSVGCSQQSCWLLHQGPCCIYNNFITEFLYNNIIIIHMYAAASACYSYSHLVAHVSAEPCWETDMEPSEPGQLQLGLHLSSARCVGSLAWLQTRKAHFLTSPLRGPGYSAHSVCVCVCVCACYRSSGRYAYSTAPTKESARRKDQFKK